MSQLPAVEHNEPVGGIDVLEIVVKELLEATTDAARANAFRAAFQLVEQEQHEKGKSRWRIR